MLYNTVNGIDDLIDDFSMPHFLDTCMAFVEAIVPWTPRLAAEYGEIQYPGAVDALTYEYLVLSLYELGNVALLKSTVKTLDMAARELVISGGNEFSMDIMGGGTINFAALVPSDRLAALNILKQQELSSYNSPMFTNKYVVDLLVKMTMMGYYSEWFGYGSTRLDEPNQRIFEFMPFSWQQVSYPGVDRD
ncbi:hypothetical protein [Kineothrix sedimenti]|uniref:Gluconate 2-dehydrogenase subunit 3-like protein n=1 Tax=Kineothrix sedimenti TaxID=3123317 RepID=A0ABZ3EU14_9FIRM